MVRRLRTLSGCLTCRRRRKKCDDVRPECGSCSRLELRCAWDASTGGHEGQVCSPRIEVTKPTKYQYDRLPLEHHQQDIFHSQHIHPELTAQCSSWISSTLSPLAMTQWRSAETLMIELQRCRVRREAIAAFAATIVSHGERDGQPAELELKSYALAGVRRGVLQYARGDLQKRSLPALIISVFLLAFTELFGRGDCHTAYDHSQALLLMLMGSRGSVPTESTAAPPLLLKLAFEVAVLGTSTLALFQRRTVGRMSSKDWQCLDMIHRRYYQGDQEAVSITSPLLQGHTALFILLLRLVHVSRMDVTTDRDEQLTAIEYRLLNFERDHEAAALVCPHSEPMLHSWTTMWRYVTIVLRIYLTSLQQHDLCSYSPQISALAIRGLHEAREIWSLTDKGAFTWSGPFTMSNTGASRNIAGCTIAFILACAVNDSQALEEIQIRLRNARECLSASHYEQLAQVLRILIRRKEDRLGESCRVDSLGRCQGRHDGLDLLRLPLGPFHILDLGSVRAND